MKWKDAKHFTAQEFDSPDEPGSGRLHMDLDFVLRLDRLRDYLEWPLIVLSGYRTPQHNKIVGGEKNSAHLRGLAADLQCQTSRERFELLDLAFSAEFRRIGIGQTYIHIDADSSLPDGVVWLY